MRHAIQQISKSVWAITEGRARVGTVTKTDDGYVARIGDTKVVGSTVMSAFKLALETRIPGTWVRCR